MCHLSHGLARPIIWATLGLCLSQGLHAIPVRTGADLILEDPYLDLIRGKRVGLITNHTGVDFSLAPVIELLDQHPEVNLVALFSPEHGLEGTSQAGETVSGGGRLFSLYGEHKAPTPEMLEGIDVLVYDIQDVGVRFYTYISTLFLSMKAAAEEMIPFVVLDRPNPIDGSRVEGPLLRAGFESFVGIHPIPVRFGMTAGELAMMFSQEAEFGSALQVVPLQGWERGTWYDQTGLLWIPPSPNMPTLTTAALYPGLCLIEATNLSEGRGTSRPFELIGAPWLNSGEVARRMNRLQLPGVLVTEQTFTPASSKYRGQLNQGIQLQVLDRRLLEPLVVALHLLGIILELHPAEMEIQDRFFDQLSGSSLVREGLLRKVPTLEIRQTWQDELTDFKARRQAYLLYP